MMKATMANIYEGISMTRGDSKTLVTFQDKMIDRLVESITNRFQDASIGVMSATKLVSFTNWPEAGDEVAGWFFMCCIRRHSGQVQDHIFYS